MTITLYYWNIRAYAQPLRLQLEDNKADWKDEVYNVGPPPTFSKAEWFALKPTLGLDFPNLPYLIDGDLKISQSMAIGRYLDRKFNAEGKTELEKVRIDMVEQEIVDYRSGGVFYNPDFPSLKEGYIQSLKPRVATLSKFLGENEYFSGGDISHVDYLAYEYLDTQRLLSKDILDGHKNLVDFMARIENRPNIKEYMASDRFIKYPLNNDQAAWGSRFVPLE